MELAEFLLARIAEDQAAARAAVRWSEGASQWSDAGEPDWQHIARWDPARVLAECDAKRRIVEEFTWMNQFASPPVREVRSDDSDSFEQALCLLAVPYADHPNYSPEWAPTVAV